METEFDLKKFYDFKLDDKEIDKLIYSVLLLTNIKLQENSYTYCTNQINKIKLSGLMTLVQNFQTLLETLKPSKNSIKAYIQKQKELLSKDFKENRGYIGKLEKNKKEGLGHFKMGEYSPELYGIFMNDNLTQGIVINNGSSIYIGEFKNNKVEQFNGVYYPDISQDFVCIGTISNSDFKGIKIKKAKKEDQTEFYQYSIETTKFILNLNSKELDTISFLPNKTSADRDLKYSFKENTFLMSSCLKGDKCYFNKLKDSNNFVSYETYYGEEEISNDQKIIISFPNNHVYVGAVDQKQNYFQGKGTYFIRTQNHGDFLFKIEGTWDKGDLKSGKVFDGKGVLLFEGEFEGNQPKKGTYYYGKDEKYIGEFKDYKMEGKGVYEYDNGDKFEGVFKNNLPEGKGTFTGSKGESKEITIKGNIIIN